VAARNWENIADFLDPQEFGDLATFTRKGVVIARDVPGIFDDPTLSAESGEYIANVSQPRFTAELARVAHLKKNDECTIAGDAFMLDHDPQSDGTGMAILSLSRDYG